MIGGEVVKNRILEAKDMKFVEEEQVVSSIKGRRKV